MPTVYNATWCFIVCLFFQLSAKSQDSKGIAGLPDRFLNHLEKQTADLEASIISSSEKYLQKLSKRESRLKREIAKTDSLGAEQLFGDVKSHYGNCLATFHDSAVATGKLKGEYLPYLDSLKGSLSFIQEHADQFSHEQLAQATIALQNLNSLQGKLQQTEQLKSFIKGRQQQLQSYLSQHTRLPKSITQELAGYKAQYYYYTQQLRTYKDIWKHPDQLLQKALAALNQLPAFQNFMKQHSELAGLFRLPAGYGEAASLNGLQTRSEIQQLIQSQVVAGGPGAAQALKQNLQSAQAQLNGLKDKVNKLGTGNGDMEMPDFKPNGQKTKTFLQRLEFGSNLQTTRANSFFPTTTDIGLSVGYKLNDKGVMGIGASYKIGWGESISHVAVSSEGVGLRSFLDYQLKGSFYLSGGFEYNYQQPFDSFNVVSSLDSWQQSGLLGVSKIVSLKSKLFKKTKVQLFWDFLCYKQVPRTQPLRFRLGYSF